MTPNNTFDWLKQWRTILDKSNPTKKLRLSPVTLLKGATRSAAHKLAPSLAAARARKQNYGMNDLHYLAARSNAKKLTKLARKKPKLLEERDVFGRRPLDVALQSQNFQAIRLLTEAKKQARK